MRSLAQSQSPRLEPAWLLAVEDAGPPEVLSQIAQAGVPIVLVPDQPSPAACSTITRIAAALMPKESGRALGAQIEAQFAALLPKITQRPPARGALLAVGGAGPPLAAGRANRGTAMIELAGGGMCWIAFAGYSRSRLEAPLLRLRM